MSLAVHSLISWCRGIVVHKSPRNTWVCLVPSTVAETKLFYRDALLVPENAARMTVAVAAAFVCTEYVPDQRNL